MRPLSQIIYDLDEIRRYYVSGAYSSRKLAELITELRAWQPEDTCGRNHDHDWVAEGTCDRNHAVVIICKSKDLGTE